MSYECHPRQIEYLEEYLIKGLHNAHVVRFKRQIAYWVAGYYGKGPLSLRTT